MRIHASAEESRICDDLTLRCALAQFPAAVTAIMETASRMRRPVDTISAEDVELLTISPSH